MILRKVKPEIRIIGIDDSPFGPKTKRVLVVGAVFRSGKYLEGVVSCWIKKDGTDATAEMTRLVNRSKHRGQLRVIMLNGIAVGGFNVIDIQKLSEKTGLPIIVVVRRKPNFDDIKRALSKFKDKKRRLATMLKAGEVYELSHKDRKVYFQVFGIDRQTAEDVIRQSATRSLVPEPVRVAHIIGSGIVLGETRGRV
jgi:hypothetical protein